MKNIFLISSLVVLLYSCGDCDLSIKIGEYALEQESRNFIVYQGNERLVFEDQNGIEHELTSINGKDLLNTRMIVRTICDEGTFDKQYEYYEIQREQIAFNDKVGKQIFYFDLKTQFEDHENLDSISIYDFLYVSSSINGNNGIIQIITEERQNKVSDFHKFNYWSLSRYIGDTTLYNREFKNVFVGRMSPEKSIYFNQEKGVLSFKISENEHWVLKN